GPGLRKRERCRIQEDRFIGAFDERVGTGDIIGTAELAGPAATGNVDDRIRLYDPPHDYRRRLDSSASSIVIHDIVASQEKLDRESRPIIQRPSELPVSQDGVPGGAKIRALSFTNREFPKSRHVQRMPNVIGVVAVIVSEALEVP